MPVNPMVGGIYFNAAEARMKTWDGSKWLTISDYDPDYYDDRDELLRKKHPGLAELWDKLQEAQERYDVYLALVKTDERKELK